MLNLVNLSQLFTVDGGEAPDGDEDGHSSEIDYEASDDDQEAEDSDDESLRRNGHTPKHESIELQMRKSDDR